MSSTHFKRVPRMHTHCVMRATAKLRDKCRRASALHFVICFRQHHKVSARDIARRLTQPSIRKKIAIESRSRCVDQHNIEISRKLAMLKSVVEENRRVISPVFRGHRREFCHKRFAATRTNNDLRHRCRGCILLSFIRDDLV